MKFIRGIHNIRIQHRGCVLTIGNFDGVHRGHQLLLACLRKEGLRRGLPVMVMLFEPQPLEFLADKKSPSRLTHLRDKLKYLAQANVNVVLCVRFDHRFAAISAKNFVDDLLVGRLGVRLLAVGDDFRFGAGREGDFILLQNTSMKYGFDVISTPSFIKDGKRISSTAIRLALAEDNLTLAETLLGHPFAISGRVVHGDARGSTIGFPTANVLLRRIVSPVTGVYAVEVHGLSKYPMPGAANIGTRPTFSGLRQQLEVHLLDITMDIYGRYINVVLRQKIRNERRFISIEALRKQISKDVETVRRFFNLKN